MVEEQSREVPPGAKARELVSMPANLPHALAAPTAVLDRFYAACLGCSPEELNARGVRVLETDLSSVTFAKGSPLIVYGLSKAGGAVIAAKPGLGGPVSLAASGSDSLDDRTCAAIERALSALGEGAAWFRGVRLYCHPQEFCDCRMGQVRELVPAEDERASVLRQRWGGKVFGQVVGGRVVSWAAVKPLSSVIWDLSVETLPSHRGHGYAASVVSAALAYIFANGKLAGWGCDRTNLASLRVAERVGFRHYALDFGGVKELGQRK